MTPAPVTQALTGSVALETLGLALALDLMTPMSPATQALAVSVALETLALALTLDLDLDRGTLDRPVRDRTASVQVKGQMGMEAAPTALVQAMLAPQDPIPALTVLAPTPALDPALALVVLVSLMALTILVLAALVLMALVARMAEISSQMSQAPHLRSLLS